MDMKSENKESQSVPFNRRKTIGALLLGTGSSARVVRSIKHKRTLEGKFPYPFECPVS
jgi:hypothetical protein